MRVKIQQRTLTDCLENVIDYRGKTPKKLGLEWCDIGYRAISANNVKFDGLTKLDSINCLDEEGYKKWMKEEVQKGDLLLTSEAPAGQVMLWMSDEKIVLSQRLFAIRTKTDVYNKYLKYYLQSNVGQFEINKNTSGSTVFGISAKMFDFIKVNLPDYDSQISIGDFLYLIDCKIELNNRINAELEAMAKTLYDYWFVQFDFPNKNGNPYKTNGGKMVWNEVLKREIPELWDAKPLSNLCNKIGDGIHGTPEYVENSNYSFINGNNLKNGFIEIDNSTNKVSAEEYNKYFIELNEGTILLSINGTLGNLAVYTNENVMLGKSAAYINCKKKNRPYCYQFLKSDHIQKKIWNIATGSTIKNLSLDSIKNLLVLFPGDVLIEKYSEISKPIDDKRKNIFKENQQLSELRDWLLPMLMNGQVKVK